MKQIFFVDFDGTITMKDTCLAMVTQFSRSGWEEINNLWEQGKLGTVECARRTFKLFNTDIEELMGFLTQIPIDPYFKAFVEIVHKNGDEIYILSDGYLPVIDAILKYNDIGDIPFYANSLAFSDEGFDIECPYYNELCGRCGTCKTTLLKKFSKPGMQTVYIGDGTSDQCPVKQVHVVFAKKGLLGYCKENHISAKGYQSFKDIIDWLQEEKNSLNEWMI